jgi:hypothetical protein
MPKLDGYHSYFGTIGQYCGKPLDLPSHADRRRTARKHRGGAAEHSVTGSGQYLKINPSRSVLSRSRHNSRTSLHGNSAASGRAHLARILRVQANIGVIRDFLVCSGSKDPATMSRESETLWYSLGAFRARATEQDATAQRSWELPD